MNPLGEWQNFYVIVGSAAGGLTGLQFVVMALIADMPITPGDAETAGAFSSPSVVHFCAVLLLSAVMAMPWHGLSGAALVWAVAGTAGALYVAWTAWRMSTQEAYRPVVEDWVMRAAVPIAAYLSLPVFAWLTLSSTRAGLFGAAASALVLMGTGIHNAWDNVVYLVFVKKPESK